MGGIWRIGGIADYWSKLELGYHVATTQNHRDAIETVELALAETERLLGRSLLDAITDHETGETRPVALVTDNGPCFKSARFAAFVDAHAGADPHPHEAEQPRPERRPRTRLRLAEVRAPLPPRDRRRPRPRPPRRALPAALQHRPAAPSPRRQTPARRPPRSDQRPSDHQLKRARNPATFVKQDIDARVVEGAPLGLDHCLACARVRAKERGGRSRRRRGVPHVPLIRSGSGPPRRPRGRVQ